VVVLSAGNGNFSVVLVCLQKLTYNLSDIIEHVYPMTNNNCHEARNVSLFSA